MDIINASLASFVTAGVTLFVLHRLAAPLHLLDRPDDRKRHKGAIPLIGGISIMVGLLVGALLFDGLGTFERWLLATGVVLVILGAIDDAHPLRVRERVLVQSLLIVAMMVLGGVHVRELGTLYGLDGQLSWFGWPFTLVALIGLLNAFNLADGIDGLASSLALVAIGGILLTVGCNAKSALCALLVFLACAILPQLGGNLGMYGARRKSFLGDAGSMLLGYLAGWALIFFSQESGSGLSPVGALWCVAIPVFDTLSVMLRRMYAGMSPFKPGRRHLHYMLMDAGLSPRLTLVTVVVIAALIWGIGAGIRAAHLGGGSNLAAFGVLFLVYVGATIKLERWLRTHALSGASASAQLASAVAQIAAENEARESVAK